MKAPTFFVFILLSSIVWGQTSVRENFKKKTTIENPFELRDPFRAPLTKSKQAEGREQGALKRDGIYTNIPGFQVQNLAELKIIGVMIGKERRALARVGQDKNITVLKEGMRLGPDGAELKAIHPGGVILVEKLVNVYGEEEFLETVIPISQ